MTRAEAIAILRPGAEWTLRGDSLEWLDKSQGQPSEAEIASQMQLASPPADPTLADQVLALKQMLAEATGGTVEAIDARAAVIAAAGVEAIALIKGYAVTEPAP